MAANSSRPAPVDLGSFPYECVGDVTLCPRGFTLSLWYRPDPGDDVSVQYSYALSTGGQSALANGIYIRQDYGSAFEVRTSAKFIVYICLPLIILCVFYFCT